MAKGWVHATFDLMAFGRSYFSLHQYKDHPWENLGTKHRELYHEWYNEFGKNWDFKNPFPLVIHLRTATIEDSDEAEKFQSMVSHDYLDKIWDTLNDKQRMTIEQRLKWFIENPKELNHVYEIDVFCGLIHRVIDGKEVVEPCPQLIQEYKRLRNYVAKINL